MTSGISPYLAEGARLMQEGEYFLAHETLEEHWVDAPVAERSLLQALIHVAVGLLHARKGNSAGALLQFGKSSRRLAGYPPEHEFVDLASVRRFLSDAPERVRRGEALEAPRILNVP